MIRIRLNRGEDKRIRSGHPWVFSNEIKELEGVRESGSTAEVFDAGGSYVGTGYYNPQSLIAVRLLTRHRQDIDDPSFFRQLLDQALELRRALYPHLDTFRLAHGEGDFLPGLVVDRYAEYLSLQILTAGMEKRRGLILDALRAMFQPKGIVARNDAAVRTLEGLPQEVEILDGTIPDVVQVKENGLSFRVDLVGGQKTGHFLDQKDNHRLLQRFVTGKRVLDCFSYSGSWGIHAASYGAESVTCVDISPHATGLGRANANDNRLVNITTFETADVFERLRAFKGEGRRFDVIVLDPPAFIKSRKTVKEGEKGYLTINRRALELLSPGGYLITCSCSFHMGREQFRAVVAQAAAQAGRTLRLCDVRTQSADHPILVSVPETEYLKCLVVQAVE